MKHIIISLLIAVSIMTAFYIGLYTGIADTGQAMSAVEGDVPYTIYIEDDGKAVIEVESIGYVRQNQKSLELRVKGR